MPKPAFSRLRPRPISVVALRGGFGNQLFAWAYGQELKREGHIVFYDSGQRLGRGYTLSGLIPRGNVFPLPAAFWRRVAQPESAVSRLIPRLVTREDQSRPPEVGQDGRNGVTFHWGYWQSLDYFSGAQKAVSKQLVNWLELSLKRDVSVCAVHVRRGDYVSDPKAAAVMGTLPLEYYAHAISRMRLNGYSDFVVYTDDKDWVKENVLPLDSGLRLATTNPAQDFAHMAAAAALITANSSYSWWAAFIVWSSGGDVIAPKNWFADSQLDSSRVVPEGWVTL